MKININACELPLPAYRHLPGVNARHAEDAFDFIKLLTPPVTKSKDALQNPAWCYGVKLFNDGFYWECHEVLEEIWSNAPPNSRERFLVQGVIHLANAALKEKLHRKKAKQRLVELAVECFERLSLTGPDKVFMALSLSDLLTAARAPRLTDQSLALIQY